jgi:hypothetical protein
MSFTQHEGVQDAIEFFTLAVVVINSVFLGVLLNNLKRQREREDAAKPPSLATRAKRVGSR